MDWNQAIKTSKKLGDGWLLPTINELKKIYFELEKKGIASFEWGCYWSRSDRNEQEAAYFDFGFEETAQEHFSKAIAGLIGKYAKSYMRLVRNL